MLNYTEISSITAVVLHVQKPPCSRNTAKLVAALVKRAYNFILQLKFSVASLCISTYVKTKH